MSAPVITLDRSREFATVHGEGITHAFEQDGLPFNHQGRLVMELVTKDKRPLVEKKLKRLSKLETSGTKGVEEADVSIDDDAGDGSDINFEAWLKDQVKYQQHELFKEARRRFSKTFTNYRDLAEFLVFDENVCSPEDVPTKLGPKD